MSIEVSRETVDIIIGLHVIFNDIDKITFWLKTPNLNFGGASPEELMAKGRGSRVLGFINASLDNESEWGAFHKQIEKG